MYISQISMIVAAYKSC